MSTHAFEAALTDFTARHLWRRVLRPLVGRKLARRCKRCVLSEVHGPLDEHGLCRACADLARGIAPPAVVPQRVSDAALTQELEALLRATAGQGAGSYDAVLLLSGGKDSAYLLHRITRDHPALRVICVLVDNGFMSPYALDNARGVLSHFDVPSATLRPPPSFVRKLFRYALTHLELQKQYSLVDVMDGHLTFDTALNFAAQGQIPLVLCGMSRVQTEMLLGHMDLEIPRERLRAPLVEREGIVLREVFDEHEMRHWFDGARWPAERVPRFVLPIAVWNPSEETILREVTELGLLDEHRSRPLVTNNALIPVIGMAEVSRFGYSCWEVEFARMVRAGQSERDYWLAMFEILEYATRTGRFINGTVEQTLARLGLTRADVGIGCARPGAAS